MNRAAVIASGGLTGGLASVMAGGNFWDGMRQGLITTGLNHLMHGMFAQDDPGDPRSTRKKIANNAKKHNGSTDWSVDEWNGRFGSGTNKCNVFVDDVLDSSGVDTGDPNGISANLGLGSPVTAGQWADPNYEISGWKVVSSPQAGDIVAIKANFRDASGHVAIMVSPTQSIGAGHDQVHYTDFGHSTKHFSNFPGNNGYVYRRYVGISHTNYTPVHSNNYYRQYP